MTYNVDFDLEPNELGFFADANGVATTMDVVVRNSVLAALVTLFCSYIFHVFILAQEGCRYKFNHRKSVSSRI